MVVVVVNNNQQPDVVAVEQEDGTATAMGKISFQEASRDSIKIGYMSKLGGNVKSWKKRLFVLRGSTLYYFKSNKEKNCGAIEIPTVEHLSRADAEMKKANCIRLETKKRIWYAYTDTQDECEEWMWVLQEVINKPLIVRQQNASLASSSSSSSSSSNNALPNVYPSISQALANVQGGEQILVYPGEYQESLIIDKSVHIVGVTNEEEAALARRNRRISAAPVTRRSVASAAIHSNSINNNNNGSNNGSSRIILLSGSGAECTIQWKARKGRISNLCIAQSKLPKASCIEIDQGSLEIDNCEITCEQGSGVLVMGSSFVQITNSSIHDVANVGVWFWDKSSGNIFRNEIFNCGLDGVVFSGESNGKFIAENKLRGNKQHGICLVDKAQAHIANNDISENGGDGVRACHLATLKIVDNVVSKNGKRAFNITEECQGAVQNNTLLGNAVGGIFCEATAQVTLVNNHTERQQQQQQ